MVVCAINYIRFIIRKKYYRLPLVRHMVRVRKGAVQIRFEILEYLFYNRKPQPRTYVWRKATNLSYDDFLKHLSYLREKNLVKETGEGQTTPKRCLSGPLTLLHDLPDT